MKHILIFLLVKLVILAQTKTDSLHYEFSEWQKSSYIKSNWIAPTALFTAGLFTFKKHGFLNKYEVKEVRDRYLPNFRHKLDDYSQYSPIALIYLLNLSGYKGKHSIKRFSSTLLLSAALTASFVLPIKHLSKVERPDKSAKNAFPSGHTATAFMAATLLHEEFGKNKSPLFSVLGYSMAASTGVYRMLNDRHWISDVFVGAAFGIVSAELSYEIMDMIYGKDEINKHPKLDYHSEYPEKPFIISLKPSFARSTGDLRPLLKARDYFMKNGFSLSLELNYFPWQNFGIGLNTSVVSFPVRSKIEVESPLIKQYIKKDSKVEAIGARLIQLGPTFKSPLSKDIDLAGSLYFGWSNAANGKIKLLLKDEYHDDFSCSEFDYIKYEPDDSFVFNANIKLIKRINRYFSYGFFMEYSYSKPEILIYEFDKLLQNGKTQYKPGKIEDHFKFSFVNIGLMFSTTL